jgi:hypothetical protein
MFLRNRWLLALCLLAAVSLLALPCLADSQARIVRLSDVQGDVLIDRATGQGFERAFVNLPITQGVKLKTRGDGRAEVEFEDGSTLRLASTTVVQFSELSLRDSGSKLSTVDLAEGMAYVNFTSKKDDLLNVNFAREHIALTEPAHFRIMVAHDGALLSVFSGDVKAEGPSGTVDVSKKRSATFDLAGDDAPKLAKSVPELSFDDWDKTQQQYHDRYMARSYNNYSPYAYGVSDLNYFGNFMYLPGYGLAWQPYFVDASWDPYMNGAWASYPGMGYTWVSAYPWGWTPYHFGNWINTPNSGWAWVPGGSWAGYGRTPQTTGIASLHLQAPANTNRSMVMVNRGNIASVSNARSNKVVITNGSAGLGVARGSLRNPAQLSERAAQRGSVTTSVRTTQTPMATSSAARQSVYAPSSSYPTSQPSMSSGRTMSAPSSSGMGRGASAGASRSAGPSAAGTRR